MVARGATGNDGLETLYPETCITFIMGTGNITVYRAPDGTALFCTSVLVVKTLRWPL